MRGRRKSNNPKTERIRITSKTRQMLVELRKILKMPEYYREGDVIEALITNFKQSLMQ
ncbi:MAG TPA: hypothetical protein VH797_04485 [Nitrososphaeraceae archaeon]